MNASGPVPTDGSPLIFTPMHAGGMQLLCVRERENVTVTLAAVERRGGVKSVEKSFGFYDANQQRPRRKARLSSDEKRSCRLAERGGEIIERGCDLRIVESDSDC
jgi:hypothetical protein